MTEAPYGSWTSPITADLIVSATIGLAHPILHGDDIYWMEARPLEGGRHVIVRRTPDGRATDLNPPPFNARTRVHEYGGGDWTIAQDSTVYFSNFADQRIYAVRAGEEPRAVTHGEGLRYADFIYDEGNERLIAVREDHSVEGREAVNTVVAIDIESGEETVLVEGSDFFAAPRLNSTATNLGWLEWNHPNMPWDGTQLSVTTLSIAGTLNGRGRVIAGGESESVLQPEWGPSGELYLISDRSGWWNIYRWSWGKEPESIIPREAEFGGPSWQFGSTYYAIDHPFGIVCTYWERNIAHLGRYDMRDGSFREIPTEFSVIRDLNCDGRGNVAFVAASPTRPAAIYRTNLHTGEMEVIKRTTELPLDEGYISTAQAIEFPTEHNQTAHAFYYEPRNKDFTAPAGELPPLIVMSHGGPTASALAAYASRIQYWTSRGFAVLDVNYGGSTGYGREYRQRLNGRWGIVDVDDCVNGARYLVDQGLADGKRLAITGGSAGGYTTLQALTTRDFFSAGASHYGVGDLEALALDTHKFESRYLDSLIGPYPERKDLYEERSPIHHVEGLDCPVAFFQGLEDVIVPPNQAETMVAALRAKGIPVAYVAFEGEQHGFRRAENIKRALEGELYFYGRIFGFTPAGDIQPLEIEGL